MDTDGKQIALAHGWGKPTVLFYEDKEATPLNQSLKDELFARGRKEGLLNAASIIAIANVQRFDWFVARPFVIRAVRATEEHFGIPIYLDWRGAMSTPPWNLPATGSTVLVLDQRGGEVYRHTGALSPGERDTVFRLLQDLGARK